MLLSDNNFDMHKADALNELPPNISAGERCITHTNTLTHAHTHASRHSGHSLFAVVVVVVLRHKLPGKENEKIEE